MFVWVLAGGRIFVTSIVDSAIDFFLVSFLNYKRAKCTLKSIIQKA
jgi:hypothetical protein